MNSLTWDSNPAAFGAVHARLGTRRVGGISNVDGRVRGYLGSNRVYDGDNERDAIAAVEKCFNDLPTVARELIHNLL